ncbi:hypothetical protein KY332_01800 [Candidatus Woesearchaeota archaeon]|nr:hypothetical protein [Candidatus Woesearchaeota archaeon]
MKKLIYLLIFLLLITTAAACRITDTLTQAIPKSYCNNTYELEAIYISGNEVKFRLNNDTSKILGYHDYYRFKQGSAIFVREILEEEAKEGPDRVEIRFYPSVCEATTEQEPPLEEATKEEYEEIEKAAEEIAPEIKQPTIFQKIVNWIKNIFKK